MSGVQLVRLVLLDGDPEGLRSVSIAGRTTVVTGCPYAGLNGLRKRDEAKRPAIYFLVGDDLQQQSEAVYIGECDSLDDRFASPHHAADRADWRHIFVASTSDRTFNKAHARRAEHLLVQRAQETKRSIVLTKQTSAGELDDGDAAFAREFAANVFVLAEILGVSVFRPFPTATQGSGTNADTAPLGDQDVFEFSYTGQVIPARMVIDGKAFIILKGSKAVADDKKGLPDSIRAMRQAARAAGALVKDPANPSFEVFTADHTTSSTSAAGSMVYGSSCAGPIAWRHATSRQSYKDWIADGGQSHA